MAYESVSGQALMAEFKKQLIQEEEDLKRHFQKPVPEVLYHYSKVENLKNIINTNIFRASNIEFLNDCSEYHYGIDLIKNVLDCNRSCFNGEYTNLFLQELERYKRETSNIFILSLSTHGDLLPLWQAYSGLNGYNIGFDFHSVLDLAPSEIICHGHVIYSKKRQEEIILEIATKLYGIYIEFATKCDPQEFKTIFKFIFTQIIYYITLFKHHAFECEKEYRFVYYSNSEAIPRIKKNNDGTPYVELDDAILNRPRSNLPLVEICKGPKNVDCNNNTLAMFLNGKEKQDIRICESGIPIRQKPTSKMADSSK